MLLVDRAVFLEVRRWATLSCKHRGMKLNPGGGAYVSRCVLHSHTAGGTGGSFVRASPRVHEQRTRQWAVGSVQLPYDLRAPPPDVRPIPGWNVGRCVTVAQPRADPFQRVSQFGVKSHLRF